MTKYDMFLMGGSSFLVLAVIMFFTAATNDMPLQKSLAVFILGAILMFFADRFSAHGINPGDIPGVFVIFVRSLF